MKTRNPLRSSTTSGSSGERAIRTFLAEESPALMARLARALEQDERIMLVGSAMLGPKTYSAASSLMPDLVVLDEHLGGVDAAELTWRLKQLPNVPRVFIVASGERADSQSRSIAAGADAVLLKSPGLPQKIQAALKIFFGHTGPAEPQPQ
jgi:DNA-binding NarL/FixJ family response regulator